jgi:hypothetical protein
MAELIGGMVCLDEDEAGSLSVFLRMGAQTQQGVQIADTLLLLADQLLTMRDRDPFVGRRFVVVVEQRRTRQ